MPEKKPTASDIFAESSSPAESDHLAQEEADDLEHERAKLKNQDLAQDIGLKKVIALGAIILVGTSIVGTFFLISASAACDNFDVPPNVQIALITGVVAGAIGILTIVTKYLFPS